MCKNIGKENLENQVEIYEDFSRILFSFYFILCLLCRVVEIVVGLNMFSSKMESYVDI